MPDMDTEKVTLTVDEEYKPEQENYLKNAEMAIEDDYNSIDGIINNGKKEEEPSVEETDIPQSEEAMVTNEQNEIRSSLSSENKLFPEVLNRLNVSLEYSTEHEGYLIYDEEAQKYHGEAVCQTARDVIEALDSYIANSFVNDIVSELTDWNLGNETELPQTISGLIEYMEYWRWESPEWSEKARFFEEHLEDISMMNLMVNRIDMVDLDKIYRPDTTKYYLKTENDKFLRIGEDSEEPFASMVDAEKATAFIGKEAAQDAVWMLSDHTDDEYQIIDETAFAEYLKNSEKTIDKVQKETLNPNIKDKQKARPFLSNKQRQKEAQRIKQQPKHEKTPEKQRKQKQEIG